MGDKKDKGAVTVFENHSSGLQPRGDAWFYNLSKNELIENIQKSIKFFNSEVDKFKISYGNSQKLEEFVKRDPTQFAWYGDNIKDVVKGDYYSFNGDVLSKSCYRPFTKCWVYFDIKLMHRAGKLPYIFPNAPADNRVICVTGRGATKDFCAFISDTLPDLEMVSKGQCFPLKLYEKNSAHGESIKSDDVHGELFEDDQPSESINTDDEYTVKDGITDEGLAHFQSAYPTETINKEDVFYYIYGLLHSEDYTKRYADNLSKELPRIPCVKKASNFWAYSQAGRDLAELHINYETLEPYPVNFAGGELFMGDFSDADFRVEQMKFGKKNKETDKSTVIYNHKITMTHIPLEAYEYVVNGKPALEWVMERQAVTKHKESGIVNDANHWACDTMHDAAYPLKLFQRVITVSLETIKIVKNLPRLDIAVNQA